MAAAKVSGFFSSLKKEVLTIGTTKTTDATFDTAKTNYDAFVFSVQTMKAHVDAWHVNARGMCAAGEHVGNDYKNVMQQLAIHPFSALANDGKATGNAMFKTFEACEKQLDATVQSHFRQLNAHFASLKERMKAREAARLDFDYRQTQVKSAHESRDKLLAKGKAESPKDAEKRVAAEKKLEDATNLWNASNTAVIADLTHLHDARHALLGNVYINFLNVQKEWLNAYANTIDNLSIPAIPPACAFTLTASPDTKAAPHGDGFADVSLGATNGNPFGAGAVTAKPPPPYAAAAPGSGGAHPHPPLPKPAAPAPVQGAAPAGGSIAAQSLYPDSLHAAPAPAPAGGVAIGASFAADDEAAMRAGAGHSA